MTHVELEGGEVFEVLNMIDDHSRLYVASRAMVVVKATDVVRVLHKSAEDWGYPASFLSDNGLIFSTQRRYQVAGATEQALFALGIEAKHARPYHPQTCGKVERFHQTLKKFLAAQEGKDQETAPAPDRSLRRLLQRGPHPSRHQPTHPTLGLWRSGEGPTLALIRQGRRPAPSPRPGRQVRADHPSPARRLHHIGIGNAFAGWRVAVLIDDLNIEIVGLDGSPLRRLVLDPTKDYQNIP